MALVFLVLVISISSLVLGTGQVKAAALTGGSVSLSDSRPSQTTVTYTISWTNVTASPIKCIQAKFNTLADGTGSVPTAMDTTSAVFSDSSTYVGTPASWTESVGTNGLVKVTFAAGENGTNGNVILTGIINGSTVDTIYYVLFNTYNNIDCASDGVDSGTISYIYTSGQAVSLTVDPSISFSVALVAASQTVNGATTTVGTTTTSIPLGTVTAETSAIGAHTLTVTTNAGSGYFVYTRYTDKPIYNVTNDINDHSGDHTTPTTMSAGTEAFGYTTDDTANYSQFSSNKWSKFTTTNAEVMKSTAAISGDSHKIGYQVGISGTTTAGSYLTTVILTCTPNY